MYGLQRKLTKLVKNIEMERTKMMCIERTSSIETEPRTLDLDQIHFAREAALYVVKTMGIEEAMKIFTKGLEPVGRCVRDEMEKERLINVVEDRVELLPPAATSNNHLMNVEGEVRDIASAPF